LAESWRDEAVDEEEAKYHVDFLLDEGTEDLAKVRPKLIDELAPASITIFGFVIPDL